MRIFHLQRDEDETGKSGTGIVAQGVIFDNGWVGMTWLTQHTSVVFYPSVETLEEIHGHGGKTRVVYDKTVFEAALATAVDEASDHIDAVSESAEKHLKKIVDAVDAYRRQNTYSTAQIMFKVVREIISGSQT